LPAASRAAASRTAAVAASRAAAVAASRAAAALEGLAVIRRSLSSLADGKRLASRCRRCRRVRCGGGGGREGGGDGDGGHHGTTSVATETFVTFLSLSPFLSRKSPPRPEKSEMCRHRRPFSSRRPLFARQPTSLSSLRGTVTTAAATVLSISPLVLILSQAAILSVFLSKTIFQPSTYFPLKFRHIPQRM